MFCPSCGFEYTQKTNYCKRCGESLTAVTTTTVQVAPPRFWIVMLFVVVALFGFAGLLANIISYHELVNRSVHGPELLVPFVFGISFVTVVALLLVWQLARLIGAYQQASRNAVSQPPQIIEKIIERPAPQLGVPTDPIAMPVERSSVVEHTTRQMGGAYRPPQSHE